MRTAFIAAKEVIAKAVDTVFNLVGDDLDQDFIAEVKDLARKLNERADEEGRRLG